MAEQDEELRLIASETGIALERDMPIDGIVRAAAATGAQRLLAGLKAAFTPAL
jgi:hypothetical protein